MVQSRLNFYKFYKLKNSNYFESKSLNFNYLSILPKINNKYDIFYYNYSSKNSYEYLNFKINNQKKNNKKNIKIKKIFNFNNIHSIFSF